MGILLSLLWYGFYPIAFVIGYIKIYKASRRHGTAITAVMVGFVGSLVALACGGFLWPSLVGLFILVSFFNEQAEEIQEERKEYEAKGQKMPLIIYTD